MRQRAVLVLRGDPAADDQPLDIARALVDLANPDVAIDPLDREILQVTVAAMDLDRVGAYPLGHFRGVELRHGSLLQARDAGIAQRRGMKHQMVSRLDL